MSMPRFKTRRTKDPGQDPHWQDVQSLASWLHLQPVPYKRNPHDKSLPHTRSLRLARQVSDSEWYVGHDTRRELRARGPPPTRVGERFPAPCKYNSWRPCKKLTPTRALIAGLTGCAAIPSPSSPTLQHASSARGTQAPPTTSSGLDLGSSVTG
jgi:hypothetical protein